MFSAQETQLKGSYAHRYTQNRLRLKARIRDRNVPRSSQAAVLAQCARPKTVACKSSVEHLLNGPRLERRRRQTGTTTERMRERTIR